MFDLLSDIGGLQGILVSLLALSLSVWNYKAVENHLVTRLFKVSKPGGDQPGNDAHADEAVSLHRDNLIPGLKDWLFDCFPERCCYRNRREKAMQKA